MWVCAAWECYSARLWAVRFAVSDASTWRICLVLASVAAAARRRRYPGRGRDISRATASSRGV